MHVRLMKIYITLKTLLHTKAVVPACGFICLLVGLCFLAPSIGQASYHCSDPYAPEYNAADCDPNRPKPLTMPLKTLDGEKISLPTLPELKKHKKDSFLAYRQRKNFYLFDNPICPTRSWRSNSSFSQALRAFRKYINDMYGNLEVYVQGGCKGRLIFDINRDLVVPINTLQNPHQYRPLTLMVVNTKSEKTFMKGVLEYEAARLGPQKGRVLHPSGEEVCRGELKFAAFGSGQFELKCFNEEYQSKGIIQIKQTTTPGHALGSGSFSDGTKFIFVTNLPGEEIVKRYPMFSGLKKWEE